MLGGKGIDEIPSDPRRSPAKEGGGEGRKEKGARAIGSVGGPCVSEREREIARDREADPKGFGSGEADLGRFAAGPARAFPF